jgi:rhodanese-related sulfurtransferase
MKNLFRLLSLLLVVGLVFASCKKDDDTPKENQFSKLAQYMQDNDMDLAKINGGFAKAGSGLNVNPVDFSVPDYYVIDIRSAADFNNGHIKGAVNIPLANILDEAPNAAGKPILVVCYTGQTATRGVAALRMKGYTAFSLKWGMAAWHANFKNSWESKAGNFSSPNWLTTGAPPAFQTFNTPVINSDATDMPQLLDERIRLMLANTEWGVAKDVVLANPENYFINNYWPLNVWEMFGYIKGAYRINEDLNLAGLKYLNPDATILTYCYTGQTSTITNAWLEVLGYKAKSLMFGTNSIVHTNMMAGPANILAVTWGGAGSGSNLNFGYYDSSNTYYAPIP